MPVLAPSVFDSALLVLRDVARIPETNGVLRAKLIRTVRDLVRECESDPAIDLPVRADIQRVLRDLASGGYGD